MSSTVIPHGGGSYPHTKITDSTTEGATWTATEKCKLICEGTSGQVLKIDNTNAVNISRINSGSGTNVTYYMGVVSLQSDFYGYDFQEQGTTIDGDYYGHLAAVSGKFTIVVPKDCTIDFAGTWEAYTV